MKHSVCMFAVAVAASALFFGCSKSDDAVSAIKEKTDAAVAATKDAAEAVKDTAVAAAEKTVEVAEAAADKAAEVAALTWWMTISPAFIQKSHSGQ